MRYLARPIAADSRMDRRPLMASRTLSIPATAGATSNASILLVAAVELICCARLRRSEITFSRRVTLTCSLIDAGLTSRSKNMRLTFSVSVSKLTRNSVDLTVSPSAVSWPHSSITGSELKNSMAGRTTCHGPLPAPSLSKSFRVAVITERSAWSFRTST